jgi:hypothetical protein
MLLTDDDEKCDTVLTFGAQTLERRQLGREDAFCVTGTAAVQHTIFLSAGEKRWYAIDVGRQDNVRWIEGRDDVDAVIGHRLFDDGISAVSQPSR